MRRLPGDLVDRLEQLADDDPDREVVTELMDGVDISATLTPASLRARAAQLSLDLAAAGVKAGDVVLLIASSPVECLVGLFGCLRAGVIAAPIAFPRRPEHVPTRLEPVRANARAAAIVAGTPQGQGEENVLALLSGGELPVLRTPEAGLSGPLPEPTPVRDIAYLQYTSGSTSEPKGVIVTHENLNANLDCVAAGIGFDHDSVIVNWNPLTHDMGMVMGALPAVAFGVPVVVMPPAAFIRRPVTWLRAITRFHGTHGYSPNFGYDLLVERATEEDRAELDLSSMTTWVTGAEAVRLRTRDRFVSTFATCGLRPESWCPAYGLAEATLLVSVTAPDDPGPVVWVDVPALEDHRVVVVSPQTEGARPLCADGVPVPGMDVVLVDPDTGQPVAGDVVGEVWVRGASVSPGYWQRPEETQRSFAATLPEKDQGGWLRTGDLAFMHEGALVICGRLKDLIVINGRNIHPQDIELVADLAHDGVRSGGTAAFSIEAEDGEAIVVLAEVDDLTDDELGSAVRGAIRGAVLREFEVRVADVMLVGPRGVPKTSSGKVQRSASRDIWERGLQASTP